MNKEKKAEKARLLATSEEKRSYQVRDRESEHNNNNYGGLSLPEDTGNYSSSSSSPLRASGLNKSRERKDREREGYQSLHSSKKKKLEEDIEADPDWQAPPLRKRTTNTFSFWSILEWYEVYLIALGAVGAAISGMVPLSFYYYFGKVIDYVGDADLSDKIQETSLFFALIALVAGVAAWCSNGSFTLVGERITSRLRHRLFKAIVQQDVQFFDQTKTGVLMTRLTEDTASFHTLFGEKTNIFFQSITQCIGGLIIAFYNSWKMTLVMLSVAPIMAVAIAVQGKLTVTFQKKSSDTSSNVASMAEEIITNFRTVKSFAGESKEIRRFGMGLLSQLDVASMKALLQGCSMGFTFTVIWGAAALAFYYGGILVGNDELTLGELVTIFGMMLFAVLGLALSMSVLPELFKCRASYSLIKDVIDTDPYVPFSGGRALKNLEGHIELEKVTFSYPMRNAIVLDQFSLNIHSGQRVALVGESGSGKSTIIALIERFYDPVSGHIKVDGVDITELDPQWYHRQIALVSQEPILFSGSIADNIRYARDDASMDDVIAAATAANAHNFIMALPEKYETPVGERGHQLSGGQKQRVAIARAVLKNPKILLLDEATSALDSESEKLVQQALDKLMVGRTSLIIAHRLSTIRDADVIYVLEKGHLVEYGTHEELLSKEGAYHKLASRQMNMLLEGTGDSSDSDSDSDHKHKHKHKHSNKREKEGDGVGHI